jgi:hypothetical protein
MRALMSIGPFLPVNLTTKRVLFAVVLLFSCSGESMTTVPQLPSDMTVYIDGAQPSLYTLGGVRAGDLSLIDTVGVLGITQSTPANQPTFDRYNVGAGKAVIFGGYGAPKFSTPTFFNVGSNQFQIPFSRTVAMRGDGVATAIEWSANVTAGQGMLLGTDTAAITIHGSSGSASFTAPAGWNSSNVSQVNTLTCDGTIAGTILEVNGVAVTLTPVGGSVDPGVGSATITGFIGQDHAGATPLTGGIAFDGCIWGRVQSAVETANIQAYLAQTNYFAPGGATSRNTICIGDSFSVGFFTQDTDATDFGFYQRALQILGSRFGSPNNFGEGGAVLTGGFPSIQFQWVSGGGSAALVSGMPNIVFMDGGINDITADNPLTPDAAATSGINTAAKIQTVVGDVASSMLGLAGGPHYIFVPTIILSSASSFQQKARRVCNDIVRANYLNWGNSNAIPVLIDVGADGGLSAPGTELLVTPYYNVGNPEHPVKTGQDRWAAIEGRAVLSLGL